MSIDTRATITEKTMKNVDFTDVNSSSIILSTQNSKLRKSLTKNLVAQIMGKQVGESENASLRSNPDIIEISTTDKNSIGIAEIKTLISKLKFKPYQSSRKIAVIHDADNLTVEAQNAFLKTLEDVPEKTFIILTTSTYTKLLPTIISRCQLFEIGSDKEEGTNFNADEIMNMNLFEKFKIAEQISS